MHPWTADLAALIPDEAMRAQVDNYLATKWQPRVTQLEQELAAKPDLPPEAAELWQDLMTDPAETLNILVGEVYGDEHPDVVEGYGKLFETPSVTETQPTAQPTKPADGTPQGVDLSQLPPEVREMFEEYSNKKQSDEYRTQVNKLIGEHAGLSEEDYDFLHPFIHGAAAQGGTLKDAADAYVEYRTRVRGEETASAETTEEAAPATLGSQGSTATGAPPTAPEYNTWNDLDKALSDFTSEDKARAEGVVTPVGVA